MEETDANLYVFDLTRPRFGPPTFNTRSERSTHQDTEAAVLFVIYMK